MNEQQQPSSRFTLPSPESVKRWKDLLELGLLLLALPWILIHLFKSPGRAIAATGYM